MLEVTANRYRELGNYTCPMAEIPSSYSMSQSILPSKNFYVKNIDDKNRIIHYGYIQVENNEVVFRYEHHPQYIARWPISCIRRYGVNLEGDVFVLEAGRKAPEGEGVFAFRTDGFQACEIQQRVEYYSQYSVHY